MLTLTEKAVAEVGRIMADQGLGEEAFLKFTVSAGGCSGMSYVMNFETEADETDLTTTFGPINVAMAQEAVPYLDNTVVDFKDDVNQRGFTFENPNASGSCGCGSSFSV